MVIVNISMLTVLHDGVSGKLKISADTILRKFDCDATLYVRERRQKIFVTQNGLSPLWGGGGQGRSVIA